MSEDKTTVHRSPVFDYEMCLHDSERVDGTFDSCCLKCGVEGYWHDGHRHDKVHPSGKILFIVDCDVSMDLSD
jgi:hypothetical protein